MTSFRFAFVACVVAGCTSAGEPNVAPGADVGNDTKSSVDAGIDGAVDSQGPKLDSEPAVDTSTPEDVAVDAPPDTPPVMPVDCFSGSFGPSSSTLVDFLYQIQVGSCESSACSDFIMFDPSCEMTLQVADVPFKATLDESDCTIFKRWLTSDLLVNHLKDTVTCYYGKDGPFGAPYESSSLTLGEGPVNKKTWNCSSEPFASHRRCLAGLRAKYFPGK